MPDENARSIPSSPIVAKIEQTFSDETTQVIAYRRTNRISLNVLGSQEDCGHDYTAAEARQLAAALTEAADHIDPPMPETAHRYQVRMEASVPGYSATWLDLTPGEAVLLAGIADLISGLSHGYRKLIVTADTTGGA